MSQSGSTRFVFTHHAEKVVAEDNMTDEAENYPMITKRGEAQTREKARMLVSIINKMPEGSVLVLCGVSRASRTRSTLAVYADELQKLLSGKKEIAFFEPPSENGNVLTALAEFCKMDRGKEIKTVVEFPFQIAEFISMSGQREEDIAKGILAGLDREEGFFRRFFPENPIIFFHVGHSIEIDALVSFLSKKNNEFEHKAGFSFM